MNKKILIVGGVAGGASTAARCRRHSEEDTIIMFEKGPHVSFSNCCLPYHLSGVVATAEELVLMSPKQFADQYNIDARVASEVVSIDRAAKTILVKNVETGEEYNEHYDKLILSPGAKPIVPPIPGIEKVNTFSIRNVVDIDRLNKFIKKGDTKNISVIGGGFIGVETAENLKEAGYNVTLIEAMPQIMKPFDYDMVQILHKELHDHGVNLIVNDKVERFSENKIILSSGKEVDTDVVVMAIGVRPETDLAKQAGLDLGKTGAMKVNQNYQTNDADIYAVGDVIEVYSYLYNDYFQLPLAGPAQKQARAVADHINGMAIDNRGYIGSSVIKVFDYNAASTGLNEGMIKALGLNLCYNTVNIIPNDKVGLMPFGAVAHFKLVYEVPTGRILGAQAIGKGNIDKRIDVIATVIKFGGTIYDLKDLELCYAPPFGTAKDIVNFAGYVATNLMNSDFKQVHGSNIRPLVESGACIVDVREESEFAQSHIKGAINIPLSEIRQRTDELPKDKPLYLHCRSGQRSYNAVLALQNMGFTDVYNVSGGFMGLCFYEYFNDKTLKRTPIVTDYNFD
ncbi:pyridine nucleotide-disulfide oxidoreductase family protein [Psychromonas sp. CNPT3]|uniref:FAD-dependent oxidoreductase n=1 Tax=Psychromonas sp. CNPT3 TaxID=314282 RepID=UPI00006E34B9|nr:FAD-dependent oxidoreductase [Psychromonas sp. CNPT3]AGH80721.1 pyridine nucleotide-disulfide oxidoreductase family protein [Psychromonas sp. CNPT3]